MELQDPTPVYQSHCSANPYSQLCPWGAATCEGGLEKNINPFLIMMKIYTFLQGGGAWVHRGDRLTNPPTFGY